MKEKEIIKSEKFNIKPILYGLGISAIIIILNVWFGEFYVADIKYDWQEQYSFGSTILHLLPFSYYTHERYYGGEWHYFASLYYVWLPLLIVSVILFIIYKWQSKMEIVVTDKRVYGKAAFGKRVDLPLDSISAISTSFMKGIAIGTSSGKVNFKMIKNNEDIHKEVSNLLLKRQHNNKASNDKGTNSNISSADELKKFKDLLDSGAITQEEYDKKKNELLNL